MSLAFTSFQHRALSSCIFSISLRRLSLFCLIPKQQLQFFGPKDAEGTAAFSTYFSSFCLALSSGCGCQGITNSNYEAGSLPFSWLVWGVFLSSLSAALSPFPVPQEGCATTLSASSNAWLLWVQNPGLGTCGLQVLALLGGSTLKELLVFWDNPLS